MLNQSNNNNHLGIEGLLKLWFELGNFMELRLALEKLWDEKKSEFTSYIDRKMIVEDIFPSIARTVKSWGIEITEESIRNYTWSILMLLPEEITIREINFSPLLKAIGRMKKRLCDEGVARGIIKFEEKEEMLEKLNQIVREVVAKTNSSEKRIPKRGAGSLLIEYCHNIYFSHFSFLIVAFINYRAAGYLMKDLGSSGSLKDYHTALLKSYTLLRQALEELENEYPDYVPLTQTMFENAIKKSCDIRGVTNETLKSRLDEFNQYFKHVDIFFGTIWDQVADPWGESLDFDEESEEIDNEEIRYVSEKVPTLMDEITQMESDLHKKGHTEIRFQHNWASDGIVSRFYLMDDPRAAVFDSACAFIGWLVENKNIVEALGSEDIEVVNRAWIALLILEQICSASSLKKILGLKKKDEKGSLEKKNRSPLYLSLDEVAGLFGLNGPDLSNETLNKLAREYLGEFSNEYPHYKFRFSSLHYAARAYMIDRLKISPIFISHMTGVVLYDTRASLYYVDPPSNLPEMLSAYNDEVLKNMLSIITGIDADFVAAKNRNLLVASLNFISNWHENLELITNLRKRKWRPCKIHYPSHNQMIQIHNSLVEGFLKSTDLKNKIAYAGAIYAFLRFVRNGHRVTELYSEKLSWVSETTLSITNQGKRNKEFDEGRFEPEIEEGIKMFRSYINLFVVQKEDGELVERSLSREGPHAPTIFYKRESLKLLSEILEEIVPDSMGDLRCFRRYFGSTTHKIMDFAVWKSLMGHFSEGTEDNSHWSRLTFEEKRKALLPHFKTWNENVKEVIQIFDDYKNKFLVSINGIEELKHFKSLANDFLKKPDSAEAAHIEKSNRIRKLFVAVRHMPNFPIDVAIDIYYLIRKECYGLNIEKPHLVLFFLCCLWEGLQEEDILQLSGDCVDPGRRFVLLKAGYSSVWVTVSGQFFETWAILVKHESKWYRDSTAKKSSKHLTISTLMDPKTLRKQAEAVLKDMAKRMNLSKNFKINLIFFRLNGLLHHYLVHDYSSSAICLFFSNKRNKNIIHPDYFFEGKEFTRKNKIIPEKKLEKDEDSYNAGTLNEETNAQITATIRRRLSEYENMRRNNEDPEKILKCSKEIKNNLKNLMEVLSGESETDSKAWRILIQWILERFESRKSPGTIANYFSKLTHIISHCEIEGILPNQLDEIDIAEIIDHDKDDEISLGAFKNYRTVLCGLFREYKNRNIPATKILWKEVRKKIDKTPGVIQLVRPEVIERLTRELWNSGDVNRKNAALVTVLGYCLGLRRIGMAYLKIHNFHILDGKNDYLLFKEKGTKQRMVYLSILPDWAKVILHEALREAIVEFQKTGEAGIFKIEKNPRSISYLYENYLKNIFSGGLHVLRRNFATFQSISGVPLPRLAARLGHSLLSTTLLHYDMSATIIILKNGLRNNFSNKKCRYLTHTEAANYVGYSRQGFYDINIKRYQRLDKCNKSKCESSVLYNQCDLDLLLLKMYEEKYAGMDVDCLARNFWR